MRRPVLALVSPLPPSESGIADYTRRLLPHLAAHWHVVVLVGNGEPVADTVPGDIEVMHLASWRWFRSLGNVSRLLICLGNSSFHLGAPDVVRRHGGVVLAHDVRMVALHCLRAAGDTDRHALSTLVERRHGPELAREIRAMEERHTIEGCFPQVRHRLEEANALLLAAATPNADRVLVHSRLAERLARLELGRSGPPVARVPFGHPAGERSRGEREMALISSFGFVAPEKNPHLLVASLPSIRSHVPGASLRFVGGAPPEIRRPIEIQAERLGVSQAVSFSGRVGGEEYQRELERATVAVQLRSAVNGECSAAVADCMASGLPVVVGSTGSQVELPDDACAHVSPEADAYEVGTTVGRLLRDERERERLSTAGRAYAEANSFSVAADALTEALWAAPPPH